MLKTRIKASQITNLTDARYFAAWNVEWLGFSLDTASEHYCTPTQIQAIKAWVEGPKMVGEFGLQTPEQIATAVEMLDLDIVQISPFSSAQATKEKVSVPIIQAIVLDATTTMDQLIHTIEKEAEFANYFLLNFDKNGVSWSAIKAGKTFSVAQLKKLCEQYSILLSIDLEKEEVEEVLNLLKPQGLNVKGGEEEKTGFKSFDEIDEIFEVLEILE